MQLQYSLARAAPTFGVAVDSQSRINMFSSELLQPEVVVVVLVLSFVTGRGSEVVLSVVVVFSSFFVSVAESVFLFSQEIIILPATIKINSFFISFSLND